MRTDRLEVPELLFHANVFAEIAIALPKHASAPPSDAEERGHLRVETDGSRDGTLLVAVASAPPPDAAGRGHGRGGVVPVQLLVVPRS